ncbi:hypothetical protein GWK47_014972 [Chionoecetes opilio]|uniref:Uncharacterized protein n=1 Tax=Chionoecetes opilio TaxID=41210 RepID=A0A8J4XVP9_CHIOP|nr:hypothetical protein GWK47_014972 [Chionoecetes opilio]
MAGVDEKLKRATEEKRRKRQRMEEMKKKVAAASSSTLDRDVALDLESSTTSSSSNEKTGTHFKLHTAKFHAVDLLRRISSQGLPLAGARQSSIRLHSSSRC